VQRKEGPLRSQISLVAARQRGYITRAQLLSLGVQPQTISRWTVRGLLIVVYTGVYAVNYVRPEPIAVAQAAVLACGKGALLARFSAAALWGMRPSYPEVPEVVSARERRRPNDCR
jgi:hypothetical protein